MTVWLTRYEPGQANLDLASVLSTGNTGYGTTLSPELTVTVDMATYAYVLTWGSSVATSANQICGARIAYYAPTVAALCTLDIDGNGAQDALTDGLIILRALFGLTGTSVTNNAIGSGTPTRTTWAQIQPYLNGNCGGSFAP